MLNDIPVSSSLISKIQYDPETQTLFVTFRKGGSRWVYRAVPQDTADSLAGAESVGSYFINNIRDAFSAGRA